MQITITAVGKRIPAWANSAFLEYRKRLSREINLRLVELQSGKGSGQHTAGLLRDEAEAIRAAVPGGNYMIALDERGNRQTTRDLAGRLDSWMHEGRAVSFIIGGAEGLDQSVLENADERWSLSDYTLPHALVRVILAEQLYRAWSILRNHPYHRE